MFSGKRGATLSGAQGPGIPSILQALLDGRCRSAHFFLNHKSLLQGLTSWSFPYHLWAFDPATLRLQQHYENLRLTDNSPPSISCSSGPGRPSSVWCRKSNRTARRSARVCVGTTSRTTQGIGGGRLC